MKKNFIGLFITTAFSIPTVSLTLALAMNILAPAWAKPEKVEITRKTINQDEVTLNLKVTDENQRPALKLKQDDFTVFVDGRPVKFQNIVEWKSAMDSKPKARVLILIDFSGSMRREDQRGTTKLQGAVEAIDAFIKSAKKRGGDVKIAILPFGVEGKNCPALTVDSQTINDKGFRSADDAVLENYLDWLKSYKTEKLCASTNLYEPLINGVEYLGDKNNTDFYPPLNPKLPQYDPQQPQQPQLSVILLSDGYHNGKDNETEEFENLKNTLKNYPQIIVHTLGYGLTPEQLGNKIGKATVNRQDIAYQDKKGMIPKGKIDAEDFVDRDRLRQIAKITNGIAGFSNNPEIVAKELTEFLNALGEYEIIYKTPFAQEGKFYEVEVEVTEDKKSEQTAPESYKIVWDSLPLSIRLPIFIVSLIALPLLGILPWWWWGKKIKNQEQ